jgi:hypothetical protein
MKNQFALTYFHLTILLKLIMIIYSVYKGIFNKGIKTAINLCIIFCLFIRGSIIKSIMVLFLLANFLSLLAMDHIFDSSILNYHQLPERILGCRICSNSLELKTRSHISCCAHNYILPLQVGELGKSFLSCSYDGICL